MLFYLCANGYDVCDHGCQGDENIFEDNLYSYENVVKLLYRQGKYPMNQEPSLISLVWYVIICLILLNTVLRDQCLKIAKGKVENNFLKKINDGVNECMFIMTVLWFRSEH